MWNTRFNPGYGSDGEEQRENKQANCEADDVVAQRCRCDDPWRQLPARHLNGDEHGAEREHDEGKDQRDDGLQRCPRSFQAQGPRRNPRNLRIDRINHTKCYLFEHKCDKWNNPQ